MAWCVVREKYRPLPSAALKEKAGDAGMLKSWCDWERPIQSSQVSHSARRINNTLSSLTSLRPLLVRTQSSAGGSKPSH
jgi:hypothetical protein